MHCHRVEDALVPTVGEVNGNGYLVSAKIAGGICGFLRSLCYVSS